MPCYYPWTGYRLSTGEVVFNERGDVVSTVTLPCGRCIGCRLDRSQEWAVRCLHEAKLHKLNCFLTLTYSDEHLPSDGSVSVRHLQLFMKRVRARIAPARVRFFAVGEYGEKLGRPHYHVLLFGYRFPDEKLWRHSGKGHKLYRSALLDELWGMGHAESGEVTAQSAGYCARYSLKKVYGDAAPGHYEWLNPVTGELVQRKPEFAVMSRRPGIGLEWAKRYESDYFPRGSCLVDGKEVKAPRYYFDKWAKENPESAEELRTRRMIEAKQKYGDNTDARLHVKAQVKAAQISSLKRSYESGQ